MTFVPSAQEPTPRNRHTSSPAISDVFSISSKQESKDPHLRQQTQESSTIPSFKLVPIVLSLQVSTWRLQINWACSTDCFLFT